MSEGSGSSKLLTEREVAARLHTSIRSVQRLRRERLLAFIPGRPVLVMESDLEEYLFKQRVAEAPAAAGPPTLHQLEAAHRAKCDAAAALARRTFKLRRIVQDARAKRG